MTQMDYFLENLLVRELYRALERFPLVMPEVELVSEKDDSQKLFLGTENFNRGTSARNNFDAMFEHAYQAL